MAVVSIEEIKEVEKFVDLWLKKKNKKTGVLLNFKGLRRLLGKRQRLLAYLAKKNRVRYKKLISHAKEEDEGKRSLILYPLGNGVLDYSTRIIFYQQFYSKKRVGSRIYTAEEAFQEVVLLTSPFSLYGWKRRKLSRWHWDLFGVTQVQKKEFLHFK
ncbi:hypothetical protein ACJX0J_010226 [Zea mays]